MIERHPDVPDNIVELDYHRTMGDYARAYGDELTRLYEDFNILYFPFFPIALDLEFLQTLTFPEPMAKIGTHNGLDKSVIRRDGANFEVASDHVLFLTTNNLKQAAYLNAQIAHVNAQIRTALRILFPHYYSLTESNMTWRLTDTPEGDLHLDSFDEGRPIDEDMRFHRLKFFINIDRQPRQWHTSFSLPDVLKRGREALPNALPADINVVNHAINRSGVMNSFPFHRIDYPEMSAVFGNAEAVVHKVKAGHRMIAGEFFCLPSDMLDPSKFTHERLPGWLEEAGIRVE